MNTILVIIVTETFVLHKIDEYPLMNWDPKRESPNPVSACQGRMTAVVGMLV